MTDYRIKQLTRRGFLAGSTAVATSEFFLVNTPNIPPALQAAGPAAAGHRFAGAKLALRIPGSNPPFAKRGIDLAGPATPPPTKFVSG